MIPLRLNPKRLDISYQKDEKFENTKERLKGKRIVLSIGKVDAFLTFLWFRKMLKSKIQNFNLYLNATTVGHIIFLHLSRLYEI